MGWAAVAAGLIATDVLLAVADAVWSTTAPSEIGTPSSRSRHADSLHKKQLKLAQLSARAMVVVLLAQFGRDRAQALAPLAQQMNGTAFHTS